MQADVVLTNGRIYTLDESRPRVSAVAINRDSILAVGDDEEMRELLSAQGEWVDLAGRGVVPGLIDAHVHFQWYSLSLQQVSLFDCRSLDEALARIAVRSGDVQENGWLLGRGWNQGDWPGGRFPTAADLDRVTGDIPAMMTHRSGHAIWANSLAMRLAGIDLRTPDPQGGKIERGADGHPTGIFFETAIGLVKDFVPEPEEEEIVEAMRVAQRRCLQAGLTGIHDFDPVTCFRALQIMQDRDELQLRVVKNVPVAHLDAAIEVGLRSGFGNDRLRIGGVKIYADGALGSRTAAMIDPYIGEPDNRGLVVTDKEEMVGYAGQASANGLSVTVHAIGDRANHEVLDVYEEIRSQERARTLKSPPGKGGVFRLRHRIEHVQVLHPDDFERLARLGILASMQPIHATSDMNMAEELWGSRSRYAYAWRDILNSGGTLVFGSDAPVEPIEPLTGIHAAVTRRRADGAPGPEGWYPGQRLSMLETIRAYTLGPAVAAHLESVSGTISPGKRADLTIFDRDIFEVTGDELLGVNVDGTMVAGRFAHRSW